MSPRRAPSAIALTPVSQFSQSVSQVMSVAMGAPRISRSRPEEKDRSEQRDDDHRHEPAEPPRQPSRPSHIAAAPASRPPTRPPRKPGVQDERHRAGHEAGGDARPVRHGVGDEAGQGRDEERHRRAPDHERTEPRYSGQPPFGRFHSALSSTTSTGVPR